MSACTGGKQTIDRRRLSPLWRLNQLTGVYWFMEEAKRGGKAIVWNMCSLLATFEKGDGQFANGILWLL